MSNKQMKNLYFYISLETNSYFKNACNLGEKKLDHLVVFQNF
jgi:hypothetical protein